MSFLNQLFLALKDSKSSHACQGSQISAMNRMKSGGSHPYHSATDVGRSLCWESETIIPLQGAHVLLTVGADP